MTFTFWKKIVFIVGLIFSVPLLFILLFLAPSFIISLLGYKIGWNSNCNIACRPAEFTLFPQVGILGYLISYSVLFLYSFLLFFVIKICIKKIERMWVRCATIPFLFFFITSLFFIGQVLFPSGNNTHLEWVYLMMYANLIGVGMGITGAIIGLIIEKVKYNN